MTRVVSVGRSHGLIAAGALGLALLTVTLTGCPGSLQDPNDFPNLPSGTAGTTGGTAGTSGGTAGTTGGTAGTTGGTAGTGAAGTTAPCDPTSLFTTKYTCTLTGACHDAMGTAAKLDMVTTGWEKMLVGKVPPGGGNVPSVCSTIPAQATRPYIVKGSNPATGLFLDKLSATPPCGMRMPELTGVLTTAELACVQSWATALANAP